MDEQPKKSGWRIWLYLTPVYIILAIPLVKWTMKNFSSDVSLSKDEYTAFNSSEGEIKKAKNEGYNPELSDIGYTLHYHSGGSKSGTQEELDWGYKEGYLLETIGNNLNNPKAVEAVFNNQWAVKGFMSRPAAKKAMESSQALRAYLDDTGRVNAFLDDKTVNAALNSPQVLDVLTQSDMAKALLETPAVKALMKSPDDVQELAGNNPRIMTLLRRPAIKAAVMASPQTAPLASALGWK
jgi:hypothetical protein